MEYYNYDSDDDRPDPVQVQRLKELHREMADRRIVIVSKCARRKKKRRNMTTGVLPDQRIQGYGSSSEFSNESEQTILGGKAGHIGRSRSFSRPRDHHDNDYDNEKGHSSDSEISEFCDNKKKISFANSKHRLAEARCGTTELKLVDFNNRLNQRKLKLEEMHSKLKIRKERLQEREERIRVLEKEVNDKEVYIKLKAEKLRDRDRLIRDREVALSNFESQIDDREKMVKNREDNSTRFNPNTRNKTSLKPILQQSCIPDIEHRKQKRISWADSAFSSAASQSPSSNSSDDDFTNGRFVSIQQRRQQFERGQKTIEKRCVGEKF